MNPATQRVRPPRSPVLAPRPARTVAEVAGSRFVKVPSWFTVGAALRVARLKGARHILVVERRAVIGATTSVLLAGAPAEQPVARWTAPAAVWVSPDDSLDEAWRLMVTHGTECLPVVSGALLIGIVTREDVARGRRTAGGA